MRFWYVKHKHRDPAMDLIITEQHPEILVLRPTGTVSWGQRITMNDQIVNFAVKNITSEDARGNYHALSVIGAFAALNTVGDINNCYTPPHHGLTAS